MTLFESSLADAPLVIGYLRPIILMPVGLLAGLPAAQVEAILAHELAHIRRQDYIVNLVQTIRRRACSSITPPSGGSRTSSARNAKTAATISR